MGAAFYLVVATWPRTLGRLQLTLKLINWSGALLIGWSLVQALFNDDSECFPKSVVHRNRCGVVLLDCAGTQDPFQGGDEIVVDVGEMAFAR